MQNKCPKVSEPDAYHGSASLWRYEILQLNMQKAQSEVASLSFVQGNVGKAINVTHFPGWERKDRTANCNVGVWKLVTKTKQSISEGVVSFATFYKTQFTSYREKQRTKLTANNYMAGGTSKSVIFSVVVVMPAARNWSLHYMLGYGRTRSCHRNPWSRRISSMEWFFLVDFQGSWSSDEHDGIQGWLVILLNRKISEYWQKCGLWYFKLDGRIQTT